MKLAVRGQQALQEARVQMVFKARREVQDQRVLRGLPDRPAVPESWVLPERRGAPVLQVAVGMARRDQQAQQELKVLQGQQDQREMWARQEAQEPQGQPVYRARQG